MSKQTTRHLRISKALAGVVAVVLVLAACSSTGSDADTTQEAAATTSAPAPTEPAAGQARERADETGLGAGGVAQPVQATIDSGRDIIFTAEMTVSVDNVAAASRRAVEVVESFGGFIFGQRTTAEPEPTSILTFKVPPNRFQDALAALGEVGEIRNQNVTADDVTDVIVDLGSRIATAEASVERLRALLEEAGAIETITALENQLLERETRLEQLRGSRRSLENQVSLATITVAITQAEARPALQVSPSAYVGFDDEGTSCPGDAGLSVVEGEKVTFCLEILNAGDTQLSDIDVRDAVIDRALDDFIVVFGNLDVPLEAGQSIVLATELDVARTLRTQTRVTATPRNEDGTVIEGKTVANTSTMTLGARDPGGIPSFREGLERSYEVLLNLIKLLVLAVGAAIPFLWVIPVAWVLTRWRLRRDEERAARKVAEREPAPSPVTAGPDDKEQG